MRKLFAITYDSPEAARQALDAVRNLGRGQAIALEDAVIVHRTGDGGVKLDQSVNTTAIGAAGGAMWGSLLGLIFLAPLVGAVAGAAAGALGGWATDYGIDDNFMRDMGQKLKPGSAALFVLSHDMTFEKVLEALKPFGGEVLYTSMPHNLEENLRSGLRRGMTSSEAGAAAAASGSQAQSTAGSVDRPTS